MSSFIFPSASSLNAGANEFKPAENKDESEEQLHSPISVESLDSNHDRELELSSPPQNLLQPAFSTFLKPLTPSSCSTSKSLFQQSPWRFSTSTQQSTEIISQVKSLSEPKVKEFIILRGLPGAGKTAVAHRLGFEVRGRRITPAICSADTYLPGDRSEHEPAFVRDAHSQCRADFFSALKARAPLIVLDDVHERRWHYQMYMDFARSEGYTVRVVELRPYSSSDLWKCWHRNVHGYDKQAFLTLCRDWEDDRQAEVLLVRFR
eukprot:439504_1